VTGHADSTQNGETIALITGWGFVVYNPILNRTGGFQEVQSTLILQILDE
jgi:hypothetical protein